METFSKIDWTLDSETKVASLLGSGINGNLLMKSKKISLLYVASLLGSGINGNIYSEKALPSYALGRFLIRKWN